MINAIGYFLLGFIISELIEWIRDRIIIRKILNNFKKELEKQELMKEIKGEDNQ